MEFKQSRKYFQIKKVVKKSKLNVDQVSSGSTTSTISQTPENKSIISGSFTSKNFRNRAKIKKRYLSTLKKLSSIFKLVIAQDSSSLNMLFSSIHNTNPELIRLILKKQKRFLKLVSSEIDKKDLSCL